MTRVVTPYLLWVVFVVTAGPLLFGYHLAELNAPEDVLRCRINNKSITINMRPCIPMNEKEFGFVTSIFSFGGLFGAINAGHMSDKVGRKGAMLVTSAGFIIGPAFMASAQSMWALALGRFLSGLSAGSSVVVAPLYIHDVAPPGYAGVFGATTQITINFGIAVAQILGLPYILATVPYWRIILAIGGIIGLLQLILLPTVQESPKWLASHNKLQEARAALVKIRGRRDVDDEFEILRRDCLVRLIDEDDSGATQGLLSGSGVTARKEEKVSLNEFLTNPEYRKPLTAIVGIMLAQQFLGINSIVMYGVSILGELIPKQSALINVIISVINLAMTMVAARLLDKIGRKPLVLTSIAGMGIFSGLLGFGIIFNIRILSAVATLLFVTSFAIGLGPVPFMVVSELVTHEAAGAAQSIGLTVNWLATFAVAYGFPLLRIALGSGYVFFVFTAMSVIFVLFVSKNVPETKGKTVEEVWGHTRRVD